MVNNVKTGRFESGNYWYSFAAPENREVPRSSFMCGNPNQHCVIQFARRTDFSLCFNTDTENEELNSFEITQDCLLYEPFLNLLDGQEEFFVSTDAEYRSEEDRVMVKAGLKPGLRVIKNEDAILLKFETKGEFCDLSVKIKDSDFENSRSIASQEYFDEMKRRDEELIEKCKGDAYDAIISHAGEYCHYPRIFSKKDRLNRLFEDVREVLETKFSEIPQLSETY